MRLALFRNNQFQKTTKLSRPLSDIYSSYQTVHACCKQLQLENIGNFLFKSVYEA